MVPSDKRAQAWCTAYMGVPLAALWPLGSMLTEEPGMRVLYGGVLGLLGAAIGLALYALTGQRPPWARVLVLVVVFLAGLLVALELGR